MAEKKLETLIVKVVKKVLKKEIGKLKEDKLPIVLNHTNYSPLDQFVENFESWEDVRTTEEIVDDAYTSRYVNLQAKENAELERKLRELKFKQELRKDWILFILRDVLVYSATMIFIFVTASFYLSTLMKRY